MKKENFWQKHKADIDVICRIITTLTALASLGVQVGELKIPQSEIPPITEVQLEAGKNTHIQ
ncbi:MAG: hypothetical protein IM466_12725 [Microcystis sp. M04BS1]|uniref:Uncharacterized protein n=2 Tax=Microcystis aeruginosa (strain PCC 7806) TaxID=267872 RepID=A8YNL8_MICA7|nr:MULTISPECIES: hypothetical protein [Microcystis]MCA2554555.1 hypothetical protein [Microcystis sp. M04BS1]TRT97528.1 MAG: hypothetical protein EWV61_18675 [Microcystis aeruginosa Ma_AC_P_19900807_S300]ARI81952.1 hypothetical protein BH695_2673 [Microcystis aeruginosa PCC 7806SL]MBE9263846.1 hypothetical protein [Microcystis sp. LEGE 00066]MDB9506804.1 hypothetical protein [Microcystis aeruginosa CS-338/01]